MNGWAATWSKKPQRAIAVHHFVVWVAHLKISFKKSAVHDAEQPKIS